VAWGGGPCLHFLSSNFSGVWRRRSLADTNREAGSPCWRGNRGCQSTDQIHRLPALKAEAPSSRTRSAYPWPPSDEGQKSVRTGHSAFHSRKMRKARGLRAGSGGWRTGVGIRRPRLHNDQNCTSSSRNHNSTRAIQRLHPETDPRGTEPTRGHKRPRVCILSFTTRKGTHPSTKGRAMTVRIIDPQSRSYAGRARLRKEVLTGRSITACGSEVPPATCRLSFGPDR
jgi:hypothetical protein